MDAITNLWNENNKGNFAGLEVEQAEQLINNPYGSESILRFRDPIDVAMLDQSSLFRLAEAYLRLIEKEAGKIRLTELKALPKKVILELYEKAMMPDEVIASGRIQLLREKDWIALVVVRQLTEAAGMTDARHNKILVTAKGVRLLLPENRAALFRVFFKSFTEKFIWSQHDKWTNYNVGQFGWAFSIYLLHRFGSEPRSGAFYASRYYDAFPALVSLFNLPFFPPELQAGTCYSGRVIDRFFVWFGFAEYIENKTNPGDGPFIKKTALPDTVFTFTIKQ